MLVTLLQPQLALQGAKFMVINEECSRKLSYLAQNSTLINHLCEANKILTNGMFVLSA